MPAHRVVLRGLQIAIAIRAGYGVLLFTLTLAFWLSGGEAFQINERTARTLLEAPAWHYAVWGGFVALYGAAAVTAVLRPALAWCPYACAFALDFAFTTSWFQRPGMDEFYGGHTTLIEWSLNAFDLSALTLLLLVVGPFTPRRNA